MNRSRIAWLFQYYTNIDLFTIRLTLTLEVLLRYYISSYYREWGLVRRELDQPSSFYSSEVYLLFSRFYFCPASISLIIPLSSAAPNL